MFLGKLYKMGIKQKVINILIKIKHYGRYSLIRIN